MEAGQKIMVLEAMKVRQFGNPRSERGAIKQLRRHVCATAVEMVRSCPPLQAPAAAPSTRYTGHEAPLREPPSRPTA